MSKLRTKNALFGYFLPKMPYLGICGFEISKTIVTFERSTFEFV